MQTFLATSNAVNHQAIFRATASPLLILDLTFVIVEVNDAYLHATKRKRDHLLGQYLFDAFPDNPEDAGADGVRNLRSSLERVKSHGVPDRMPVQKYDIPDPTHYDGRFEERYWSPVNTPVFDEEGRLTHIIHQVEDVTARLLSEAALAESERRFRALTNATSDVVYRMSADWKYIHELDGRGFLKDTAAMGEYRIEEYVYPEDLERGRQAIEEAIRNKRMFELEHRVVHAGGGHGWTYSRAVPLLDAAGNILEWIGSASDITARKIAEEQLMEAHRRKDEFLAMLAHELRNPLAPINAAAQLLQLRAPDEGPLRRASQVIERQVAHMTHLVDELLDVSRVARGLVKLDSVPLDLQEVVTDAVEQATPPIQSRRHTLLLELSGERALVAGDKKRLVQTIANLLNNAAKFTPEGGRIVLATEVFASQVRIEVSDNGIGMTPETVAHAFDLFSQAERSSDRTGGGLGLGLALVKSLVELHGGSVSCGSAGIGHGSRFTVVLPRAQDDAIGYNEGQASSALPAETDRLRILVVDDNADAAAMLAMFLEATGHEVLVENGSHRGLERARTCRPDVCILDVGLPDMDGNTLARCLRAQPETREALLIAVTGYGQQEDLRRSAEAGFDHHLVKPVDMKKLGAILSEAPRR